MAMKKIGKKKVVKLARDLYRGDVCERCGATRETAQLQAAHILPEEIHWTSFVKENILTLCASCHKWGILSMHKNPIFFAKWFNKKFPGRYERLVKMARQFDWTPDWWNVYRVLKLQKARKRNDTKNAEIHKKDFPV